MKRKITMNTLVVVHYTQTLEVFILSSSEAHKPTRGFCSFIHANIYTFL